MEWLEAQGFDVQVDRETGVIRIQLTAGNALCVKADYAVLPLTQQERSEFEERKTSGFYIPVAKDINEDGLTDYELWTELGKQIVWGVACE